MDVHQHHEELMKGITAQFKDILTHSKQSIYIYLDDIHMVWNKKFSSMLGYNSSKDMSNSNKSFLERFVDDKSQNAIVGAYRRAMEKHVGSTIAVTWKKKNGNRKKTNMILVPIEFKNHIFAMHYIE